MAYKKKSQDAITAGFFPFWAVKGVTTDRESERVYIIFNLSEDNVYKTLSFGTHVKVDYDREGRIIGIEVIW